MEKDGGFTGILIRLGCILSGRRKFGAASVKKKSKFWQYVLSSLFIMVVFVTALFLFMENLEESVQITKKNPMELKGLEQARKGELWEIDHSIDNTENNLCDSIKKTEIKSMVRSDGSRIVPPVLIKQVDPEYPEDAQKQGIQGKVIFEAEISVQGRIKTAKLIKSVHSIFILPSLKAIQQWIYRPMLFNGQPCKCLATITCVFRLTKKRKKIPVLVWTGII